jgi:hypothetical protein
VEQAAAPAVGKLTRSVFMVGAAVFGKMTVAHLVKFFAFHGNQDTFAESCHEPDESILRPSAPCIENYF